MMLGALFHLLLSAALAGLALVGARYAPTSDILWGAIASIAPCLFYGREMRDHQRERQSEGIGHRNRFRLLDLVPGVRPFRIGTIADWVGPMLVYVAFFVGYFLYLH